MKSLGRWRVILAGLVLLAGLGVGGWVFWKNRKPAEPRVGGKTESQWIEALATADPDEGSAVVNQLADLGEVALPVLHAARKHSDLRVHRRAVLGLIKIGAPAVPGLIKALPSGEARVRVALVAIGSAAVPALEAALKDTSRAEAAARILGEIGAKRAFAALPALLGLALDRESPTPIRVAAIEAVGRISPDNALATLLNDRDVKVRVAAARALDQPGEVLVNAIPSLCRAIHDADSSVAAAACDALGNQGSESGAKALTEYLLRAQKPHPVAAHALGIHLHPKQEVLDTLVSLLGAGNLKAFFARVVLERWGAVAVPRLVIAMDDKTPARLLGILDVLGLMGPRAKAAIPQVKALLKNKSPDVVLAAARALLLIAPLDAAAVVPVLLPLAKGKDDKVYPDAWTLLAEVGPDARGIEKDLRGILEGEDELGAAAAARVLGRVRPVDEATVKALTAGLKRKGKVRLVCLEALANMESHAGAAAAAVETLLKDKDARVFAAIALARIDPNKTDAIGKILSSDLLGSSKTERASALAALGEMDRLPSGVVDGLIPLVGEAEFSVPAIVLLQRLSKHAAKASTQLVLALFERNIEIWQRAGWALRFIGPPAMSALKMALKSPRPERRAAAVWVLGWKSFAKDKDALEHLERALDDPDESVCLAAAEALSAVPAQQPASVEKLWAMAARPEAEFRIWATSALGVKGVPSKQFRASYLRECLFDPDPRVRAVAWRGLSRLKSEIKPSEIETGLRDADPEVRLTEASLLATDVHKRMAALKSLARRGAWSRRFAAVSLLTSIDAQERFRSLSFLTASLQRDRVEDRLATSRLLLQLNLERERVVPLLLSMLHGWDVPARTGAAQLLGEFGTRDDLPHLKRRLILEERAAVRREVRSAITRIEKRKP